MRSDESAAMSITGTATGPNAADQAATTTFVPTRHRPRLVAVAAVAIGLSLPITGAGSAIASPHPPSLTSAVAATSALTPPVAMGKLDV
jgi:hypothetical protein